MCFLATLIFTTLLMSSPLAAQLADPFEAHFYPVWARTDGPVSSGLATRTWVWGPTRYGETFLEPYAESPGGYRMVQYFDKSRMEITDPTGNQDEAWFVTNGLLVVELVTGQVQVGHGDFIDAEPAETNVAGDPDDRDAPTYATFSVLLDEPATPIDSVITMRVDRDANVTLDPEMTTYNVTIADIDDVTGHSIAQPFWDFMRATGVIWEGGEYVTGRLFSHPLFALGRPITEPYWSTVEVAGTEHDVLLQCFERRCLTFTPAHPEGWQVEAGNVGRHYYDWRYQEPVTSHAPVTGQ